MSRLEPDHHFEEWINTPDCIYEVEGETVLCVECGECKEVMSND